MYCLRHLTSSLVQQGYPLWHSVLFETLNIFSGSTGLPIVAQCTVWDTWHLLWFNRVTHCGTVYCLSHLTSSLVQQGYPLWHSVLYETLNILSRSTGLPIVAQCTICDTWHPLWFNRVTHCGIVYHLWHLTSSLVQQGYPLWHNVPFVTLNILSGSTGLPIVAQCTVWDTLTSSLVQQGYPLWHNVPFVTLNILSGSTGLPIVAQCTICDT